MIKIIIISTYFDILTGTVDIILITLVVNQNWIY